MLYSPTDGPLSEEEETTNMKRKRPQRDNETTFLCVPLSVVHAIDRRVLEEDSN